ncbi:hypothetical protein VPH35_061886 [Triticum aestivum]
MTAGLGSIDQFMLGSGAASAAARRCSDSICISVPAAARRCSGSICISATRQLGGAAPPSASQAAQQLRLQLGAVELADGAALACGFTIRQAFAIASAALIIMLVLDISLTACITMWTVSVIRSILSDISGNYYSSSTGPNSVLKNLLRRHLFRLCRHSLELVTFHGKGGSNRTTVAAIVALPSLEGSVDT